MCTVFLEPFFNHGSSPSLMNAGLASVTLVAASVGLPLVFARLPWLLALGDEVLFPLFGLVANSSPRFGVQVVVLVVVDFGQSSCSVFVNLKVVLVEDALPGFFLRGVDAGGPLPCSEGYISLALS